MFFYHYTFKEGSGIYHAVVGNFSGHNVNEIIVSRGRALEILIIAESIDGANESIFSVLRTNFNARIYSLEKVKSLHKDYIAVGSDNGKLMILEFVFEERCFKPVFTDELIVPPDNLQKNMTGISPRFTPAQFLAVDPVSLDIAIGALEGYLMFYTLTEGTLEFNRPIILKKPRCIIFDLISVYSFLEIEVSFFATLEVRYEDNETTEQRPPPPMYLNIYKWYWTQKEVFQHPRELPMHANKLISVPPDRCHRGGIIVCFLNQIVFIETHTNEEVTYTFPQRKNLMFENCKGVLISGSVIYKTDDILLIFLQSEEGDLFYTRITRPGEKLQVKMIYIDTIPVASTMCIIEEVYLFVAADFGDHYLYKIKSLEPNGEINVWKDVDLYNARELKNLEFLCGIDNLTPVINCIATKHVNMKNVKPTARTDHSFDSILQFHFLCGQRTSSTLRTLRYGVQVTELKSEQLPIKSPYAIRNPSLIPFSKFTDDGECQNFIIIAFSEPYRGDMVRTSRVLSVDENIQIVPRFNTVRELLLDYVRVHRNATIQVFSDGFQYHNTKCKEKRKIECRCKAKKKIDCIVKEWAVYKSQIALALECKELVYVEIAEIEGGNRLLIKENRLEDIFACCLDFVTDEERAEFLVICLNNSIQVYAVEFMGIQCIVNYDLSITPSSLVICNAVDCYEILSYLNVGYEDGTVQRFIFDRYEKEIRDSFSLKLGVKRVKLIKINIYHGEAILALSNHTWISFNCKNQFQFVPLLSELFDCIVGFSSQYHPKANLIAVRNEKLLFLEVKNLCTFFTENRLQTEFSPRQSLLNIKHNFLIIFRCDPKPIDGRDGDITPQYAMDIKLRETNMTRTRITNRIDVKYDSELCIYDPVNKKFLQQIKFDGTISPSRMCLVEFYSRPEKQYLLAIVKKSKDCKLENVTGDSLIKDDVENFLHIYEVSDNGTSLSESLTVKLKGIGEAICPFIGRALVSIENQLFLCDYQNGFAMETSLEMPSYITHIYAIGYMFVLLCKNHNVIYGYWNENTEKLVKLHEDIHLQATAICFWNDNIMIAADVDGDLNVVLLPAIPQELTKEQVKEMSMNLPEGNGMTQKTDDNEPGIEEFRILPRSYVIVKHFVGKVITTLQKTSLVKGGRDLILYTTVSGSVGVLVPFLQENPNIMFAPLQYLIREKSWVHYEEFTHWPENCASLYELFAKEPPEIIIDGNLCDYFNELTDAEQMQIGSFLQMRPYLINEKLAELKAKLYF